MEAIALVAASLLSAVALRRAPAPAPAFASAGAGPSSGSLHHISARSAAGAAGASTENSPRADGGSPAATSPVVSAQGPLLRAERLEVPHLGVRVPSAHAHARNPARGVIDFTPDSGCVLGDIVRDGVAAVAADVRAVRAFVRAGPRAELYFSPPAVTAAIVTCGGLCPGLNNIIREVVQTLASYGARGVLGVERGFWGFHASSPPPRRLDAQAVADIHHFGGSVLGSDRGGEDPAAALAFAARHGVSQLYVVGGDGTHRGAAAISAAAVAAGLPLAVCGVPKTIDNDVDLIDRSFGFDSAVAEAQVAIRAARVEACGVSRGVSLVKVMGRYAGFIAAMATLASGDVDLVLLPELPVALDGAASVLGHLERVLSRRSHAVVVIAEGAAEDAMAAAPALGTDAGGNRRLPPVLSFFKARVEAHFNGAGAAAGAGGPVTCRAIDPSYCIRSVAANPADAIYCTLLAQSAVHGAMAGYTAFSVGLVNNRMVYLPIDAITATSPRRLNPRGRTVERLLLVTGQPDPLADAATAAAWRAWQAERAAGHK